MSFSTNPIRQLIAATDNSRPSVDTLTYNPVARNFSAALNAVDCATEAANCVPGISFFSGIGTMVYGAVKLWLLGHRALTNRDAAFMLFKSGAGSIGLAQLPRSCRAPAGT